MQKITNKGIQDAKDKRHEPLDSLEVTLVNRAIRENTKIQEMYGILAGELGLRVAIQLRDYGRLQEVEKKYMEISTRTTADTLREIADGLEY